MRITSYSDFSFVSDKRTEDFLLPLILKQTDNSQEYIYCKSALREIVKTSLSIESKELLTDYYIKGISKTQLAHELGVVPSTIVKRIQKAHKLVADQLDLTLRIYRRFEKEKED